MKHNRLISLFLLAAMLATASCGGGSDNPGNDDTTPGNASDTTPIEAGYDYQGKNFGGYEFKVLNTDVQYGCYIRVDHEEQTGEQLDDAIYDRNRKVEEKLGFTFKEIILPGGEVWSTGQIALCDALIQSVMADEGEDGYDAAYLPVYFKPDVVTGGYLLNLLDIPELKVYDEYWDATINQEMTVSNSLLTASGPLNFMSLDLSWLLLFNEELMTDYKMEFPYQLVRDGKWTMDKLHEYVSAAANLNGDESFNFNVDGNAVYGITAHTYCAISFLHAAGVRFYTRNDANEIELTLGSDRFYSAVEKLANMATLSDGKIYYKNEELSDPTGYQSVFNVNRGLFLTCELKAAQELRGMEATFGLVPMPKMDENQDDYVSLVNYSTEFLVIPKTQRDTARAGFILDALTYESYHDVLPTYYDVTVSQKGLRNDDSIEMLDYIWANRTIDANAVLGISTTFDTAMRDLINKGTGDISGASSLIATHETSIMQKLADFIEAMETNNT